jgi:hypothetical protein
MSLNANPVKITLSHNKLAQRNIGVTQDQARSGACTGLVVIFCYNNVLSAMKAGDIASGIDHACGIKMAHNRNTAAIRPQYGGNEAVIKA